MWKKSNQILGDVTGYVTMPQSGVYHILHYKRITRRHYSISSQECYCGLAESPCSRRRQKVPATKTLCPNCATRMTDLIFEYLAGRRDFRHELIAKLKCYGIGSDKLTFVTPQEAGHLTVNLVTNKRGYLVKVPIANFELGTPRVLVEDVAVSVYHGMKEIDSEAATNIRRWQDDTEDILF